jgi:hypothetical protein
MKIAMINHVTNDIIGQDFVPDHVGESTVVNATPIGSDGKPLWFFVVVVIWQGKAFRLFAGRKL